MKLSASNEISMIFQGTVEERNSKLSRFKTLLSLNCLHTNALQFYSLLRNFVKITIQYRNYKEIPSWKEYYGGFTHVLRHLTKYSWWVHQPSSASINLHSCFEFIVAMGLFVNSRHLWFLCRTIIDEQSASKTEKKDWPWECPFTKRLFAFELEFLGRISWPCVSKGFEINKWMHFENLAVSLSLTLGRSTAVM